MPKRATLIKICIGALALAWLAAHIPGLLYGTYHVPLHASYLTSDEQLPVNGALHMLASHSLLGVRDSVNYYGPIFALVAIPAVLADFAVRTLSGVVHGVAGYRDFIVWNWGGILGWARFTAILVGLAGLAAVYRMFSTRTLNPASRKLVPVMATALLAFNYLYFEYSNFFRHWIFITVIALWQMYLAIRIVETDDARRRRMLWIWQAILAVGLFGVSYYGIVYEIIWLPVLIRWLTARKWSRVKELAVFVAAVIAGSVIVVAWYPFPFEKMLGATGLAPALSSAGAVLNLASATRGTSSLWFYAQVVVHNNIILIIAGLILGVLVWKISRSIRVPFYSLWIFLLPSLVNFVFFSIPAHHESRYVLPSVAFGVMAVAALYSWARSACGSRHIAVRCSTWLVALSLILGAVQIVGWERMIAAGPPERREIVSELVAWQKAYPESKTLALKGWLFGYVHTQVAYADFIGRFAGSGSSELWRYIASSTPPAAYTPINVFYSLATTTAGLNTSGYDHVVVYHAAHIDPSIWSGSPNDEFDLLPWTVWDFMAHQDTYTIIR